MTVSSDLLNDWLNEVGDSKSTGGRPSFRRSRQRDEHVKRVHAVFGLIGFIVGIAAAVYAYSETSSIMLAIFLVLVIQNYIGRGLGDVVTDPEKVKRFIYFTMQPLLAGGILWLTYQWWDKMWLAAILGFVVGAFLWAILGALLFPRIAEEEQQDNLDRMKHGGVG